VHVLGLRKPDGRELTLYARAPIGEVGTVSSPRGGPSETNPQLRWHPLRGEWVAYAPYRQTRTFLPPPEYNPLQPSSSEDFPTELPTGSYDVAVFDNLYPSLSESAREPPPLGVAARAATGRCEVVVFTQDPATALGRLPLDHIELVLEVLGERTRINGARPTIQYVLPFENRGEEVGVTLHHPHGQIYAYPLVPPVAQRMQEIEAGHYAVHRRALLEELLARECDAGARLLYAGEHALAFVPLWARYPYEVWVAPRRARPYLHALAAAERADVARALKTVLLKYDGLWGRPFPYVMAWFQAPTDGREHPEAHLHAEFYPPWRSRDRLKYLAGTELAAGLFVCDALPEERVRELQAVPVELSDAPSC
jgi:UDPglucose--hexose-1-phosphate uridylyltransferase